MPLHQRGCGLCNYAGMSTLISDHYEIRQGGVWTEVERPALPDFNEMDDETIDHILTEHARHPLHLDQDYGVYAVLANVRNSICVEPIAFPRGLPDDLSASVRERHAYETSSRVTQGHHHESWFSLHELQSFDWDQPLRDLNLTADGSRRREEDGLVIYRDVVRSAELLTRILPFLRAQVADPRDVRMVFWFDYD